MRIILILVCTMYCKIAFKCVYSIHIDLVFRSTIYTGIYTYTLDQGHQLIFSVGHIKNSENSTRSIILHNN